MQGAQGLNNPLVRSLSPSRGPVGTLPTGPAPWCEGPTEQGDAGGRPRLDPNPEQRGSEERARKWWGVQAVGVGGHSPEQGKQWEPIPYDESPVTQGQLSLRGQRIRQPHLTPAPQPTGRP